MPIWRSFRRARICFLREDGGFVDAAGEPADPRRAGLIGVSRALCRFQLYRPPTGLKGARLVRAARLFAETRAPFAASEAILLRHPEGVAVWWWDADLARERLAEAGARYAPERLLPESLLRPAAEEWRQVRTVDGYEAQLWRDDALYASMWRRRPFTADQWLAFTHATPAPDLPAARSVPSPEHAPVGPPRYWAARRLRAPWGWPELERTAAAAALAAASIAACFTVQAVWWTRERDLALDAMEARKAQAQADPAGARAVADLTLIRAFQSRATPSPLPAAAEAFRILEAFQAEATGWSVDSGRFRARLAGGADDLPLRDLAAALEESPQLRNVDIRTEGADAEVVLEAELERGGRS